MRFLILSILTFALTFSGKSQIQVGKNWLINLNGSYVFFKNEGYKGIYHEGVVELQTSLSITKSLYVGGHGLLVASKNRFSSKAEPYFIGGLFIHYNLLPRKRVRLFPELSYSFEDFCPCAEENPNRQKGLHYLGMGFGAQFPLMKNDRLYFHVSFNSLLILNRLEEKSGFHRYKLGLVYRLGE